MQLFVQSNHPLPFFNLLALCTNVTDDSPSELLRDSSFAAENLSPRLPAFPYKHLPEIYLARGLSLKRKKRFYIVIHD